MTPDPRRSTGNFRVDGAMTLACFLGLFTMLGQVLLVRGLLTVLLGNELAAGLALGGWLLWTGLGSILAARIPAEAGRGLLPVFQACAGLLLPATLTAIPLLPSLAGVPAGELPGPGTAALLAVALPAPLCLAAGAQFPLVVRRSGGGAAAPARAYLAESLGGAAAGLAFSMALAGRVPGLLLSLLLASASLAVAAHTLAADLPRTGRRRPAAASLLALALSGTAALFLAGPLERLAPGPGDRPAAARKETAHGLVTAVRRGGQLDVYENGLFSFSVPDPAATEESVHVPLAARAAGEPADVLLVGGAVSGALAEVLKHPVSRVDCVEPDPAATAFVASLLPPGEAAALRDPRVSLHADDPRRFVREAGRRWDAVILSLPEPRNALVNRLYTAEFFTEVRRSLRPGGLLALGVDAPPNAYLGGDVLRRDGAVWLALREAFPSVAAIPLERTLFLASSDQGGIDLDPRAVARRLTPLAARLSWALPEATASRLSPSRRSSLERSLDATPGGLVNRDARPVAPLLEAVAWWRLAGWKGRSPHGRADPALAAAMIGLLLAVTLLPARLLSPPGRLRWGAGWVVAGTGFSVLSLEVLLLYAWQVSRGNLLGELGALLALVMLGLALGALAATKVPPAGQARWSLAAGLGILALALVALAATVGGHAVLGPGAWAALPPSAFLLGFLPGLQYPLLAALWGGESGAGVLYGLDLAGGCLGAALTGAATVPLAGPAGAAALAAAVMAAVLAARLLCGKSGA